MWLPLDWRLLLQPHFLYGEHVRFEAAQSISIFGEKSLLADLYKERNSFLFLLLAVPIGWLLRVRSFLLPGVLLASLLAVFAVHRPYWHYYYLHALLPVAWIAALMIMRLLHYCIRFGLDNRERLHGGAGVWAMRISISIFALGVVGLASLDFILKWHIFINALNKASAITEKQPLLDAIRRHSDVTDKVFTSPQFYGFYAKRLPPVELAAMSLKRLATDLPPDRLDREIVRTKVKLIVRDKYLRA